MSENEKLGDVIDPSALADQAENAGEAAAEASEDAKQDPDAVLLNQAGEEIDGDTEVPTAELPVGELDAPPNPPEQTAEEIAVDEAEKQAQADAADDKSLDPAAAPPEPTPGAIGVDKAASDAEDRETADEPLVEPVARLLPEWKCHKVVHAFLIMSAESLKNGRIELRGIDPHHVVIVEAGYVDKHHPQIGGYYVRYHDGYQSWSPADAFEGANTLVAD